MVTNIGEARVQSLRLVNLLNLVPDLFICVGSVLEDRFVTRSVAIVI